MEQRATVIEIEGNKAVVRGTRASACGGCAGKAACSTMGSWRERSIDLKVDNRLEAAVGDEVVLEIPDGLLLKVSFRLYAVPMLIFVLVGASVSSLASAMQWPAAELIAAVAALLAVPLSYFWLSRRSAASPQLDVRMVRILCHDGVNIPIAHVH